MKAAVTMLFVTAAMMSALPASAHAAQAKMQTVSATADLPLTDQFADLLTSYRNCVLLKVEAAPLGAQQEMAKQAMSACALSRSELRAQLVSDIQAQQPDVNAAVALRSADSGMDEVDPMIEAAALNQAHLRYARNMI